MRKAAQHFSLSTQKRRYAGSDNRRMVLLLAWKRGVPPGGFLPVTTGARHETPRGAHCRSETGHVFRLKGQVHRRAAEDHHRARARRDIVRVPATMKWSAPEYRPELALFSEREDHRHGHGSATPDEGVICAKIPAAALCRRGTSPPRVVNAPSGSACLGKFLRALTRCCASRRASRAPLLLAPGGQGADNRAPPAAKDSASRVEISSLGAPRRVHGARLRAWRPDQGLHKVVDPASRSAEIEPKRPSSCRATSTALLPLTPVRIRIASSSASASEAAPSASSRSRGRS